MFFAFSAPTIIWLLVFFLIPLGIIWFYSVGENVSLTEIDVTWTLSNYDRIFEPEILTLLWRSLWLAGITTIISLIVAYPVALVIATAEMKWKPWLLLIIILPFWTNLLIRTFAILEIIRNQGLVNTVLIGLGVIDQPLDMLFTDIAILLGMTYVYIPLMILPIYASMERLDFRLVEAAYDLYASRWRVLVRVILPLVKPGVIAGSILVFIPSLGAYVTPRVLGGGKHLMIGNLIELQFGQGRNWPLGAALSLTLLVIVMVALMVYVRSVQKEGAGHGH